MVRLNAGAGKIRKKTTFDGVDINLKDWPQVYDAYVRLAGNELKHPAWGMGAKDMLDAVVTGRHALSSVYNMLSDGKDGGKAAFIQQQISGYRALARQAILADPQFADFADAITEGRAEKSRRRGFGQPDAAEQSPGTGGGFNFPSVQTGAGQ